MLWNRCTGEVPLFGDIPHAFPSGLFHVPATISQNVQNSSATFDGMVNQK